MSTEDKVLQSLLTGLTKDDKISILQSIKDTREEQIEQKRHPRPRRHRNEDGALEPLADESPVPTQSRGPDEIDLAEAAEMCEFSE